MGATPGTHLAQFYFYRSRMGMQKPFKGTDFQAIRWCTLLQKVGKKLITPRFVMSIQLSISRDHMHLRLASFVHVSLDVVTLIQRSKRVCIACPFICIGKRAEAV